MDIDSLIDEHSGLIYKIASFYKNSASLEDLYQVGVIGLIKAFNNYEKDRDVKFSTYAFDYIRGEILSYLRKNSFLKVSKEYYKLRKSYETARELMIKELSKVPTFTEVCLYLGVEESLMEDVLRMTDSVLSLDYENEKSDLYDFIGSNDWSSTDDRILLEDLLSRIPEEDRKILEYRYFKDYTQEKTAAIMGISQIQVCRAEKRAILKLQKEAA